MAILILKQGLCRKPGARYETYHLEIEVNGTCKKDEKKQFLKLLMMKM